MINELKLEFDILGISESRILKSQSLNTNVSLQNYVIEQTPTESTAGGALLYINKRHSYKTRPDLAIYKPKKLESIFVEVVLPKKSNLIVGCIYKHHAWIYAHLIIIILICCQIIYPSKQIKQLFS